MGLRKRPKSGFPVLCPKVLAVASVGSKDTMNILLITDTTASMASEAALLA